MWLCFIRSFLSSLAFSSALVASAQPPIAIDWIQDQQLWNDTYRGVRINPSSGTVLFQGGSYDNGILGCRTGVVSLEYSITGEPVLEQPYCLQVVGISQMLCNYYHAPSGGRILVSLDIGSSGTNLWISGLSYTGWYEPVGLSAPQGASPSANPTRHAILVSGNNFFFGGHTFYTGTDLIECADRIWKSRYPHPDAGPGWSTCLGQAFVGFEMYQDTLLAIGFPTVTKVDTTNGGIAGSFDLYEGPAIPSGHTAMDGDTLYWACQFGSGQLHVGRYLVGSGPVWEVELPLSGGPKELYHDGMGRLWTAIGNRVVVIDADDGTYQEHPVGLVLSGLDMAGSAIAITGSFDGTTSYVMHGHVTP